MIQVKSRIELRNEVCPGYPDTNLLQVCQEVHGVIQGSVDRWWTEEELDTLIKFMDVVNSTWDPPHEDSTLYDLAVLNLVIATRQELVKHKKERQGITT